MSDSKKVVQNLAIHLNLQSLRQRRSIFEISYGTNDGRLLNKLAIEVQRAIGALNGLDRALERIGEVVEVESERVMLLEDEKRGVKRRSDVEVEDLEYGDL